MTPTSARFLLAVLALALGLGPAKADEPPSLRAGFGAADITPPLGKKPVYIAGFGKNRKATGVHDPLMARAVVLEGGKKKIALVSVDLIGFFLENVENCRKELPGFDYVLVSSTHNHEGPDTVGLWGPTLFQSGVDHDYLKQVEAGVVKAVQQADRSLTTVKARLGKRSDPDLVHDSRKPIVKHDELVALQFVDEKGKNAGVVVNWHCHPETLDRDNTLLSADFVYGTIAYLEKKYQCPAVYLTGTVGGLLSSLSVVVKDDEGRPLNNGTFEKTERYGQLVGKLAEKALAAGEAIQLTPFELRVQPLFLPVDNLLYQLAWRGGMFKRQAFLWEGDSSKAKPVADLKQKGRMGMKTEIGLLRLGELQIAAIPGEIYPELVLGKYQDPVEPGADFPDAPLEPPILPQLEAKHRLLIGLANDEIGYIIPKRQWDEKPPFCYGRKTSQYGEVNSLGPDAAPLMCDAFRKLAK